MRLLDAILNANSRATDGKAPLVTPDQVADSLPLVALSCIDARLNRFIPEALGVLESHFIWLRNAGNIITGPMSSTMRSLALACAVKGGKEILIIGHTDCLVRKTSTLDLLGKFAALGVERSRMPENLQEYFGLFASERQNVLKAVEHVRASPLIGPRVPVHGVLMDIETGKLELLVNGYQTLEAATSAAPKTAAPAQTILPSIPLAASKDNQSIGEMQFPQFKIGDAMQQVKAMVNEMSPQATSATPKPASTPAKPAGPPPVPADAIPNLKRLVDLSRQYRVIGGDGKQYGPVPASVLLRWIGDGRADAETPVQVDGTGTWVKLAQLGDALRQHSHGARRK